MSQIPLNIDLLSASSFANYVPGPNAGAVDAMRRLAVGELDGSCLSLWGPAGTGKSHLTEAALRVANDSNRTCAYLALKAEQTLSTEALSGLESLALIAVDDVDVIAGDQGWEQALFQLYIRCESQGAQMVLTSTSPVRATQFGLADLASRLSSGPTFQLRELSESDRVTAIQLRAEERGYELPDDVCDFLLRRSRRDMHTLSALLNTIERLTLERKSPVTIPLVKAALE